MIGLDDLQRSFPTKMLPGLSAEESLGWRRLLRGYLLLLRCQVQVLEELSVVVSGDGRANVLHLVSASSPTDGKSDAGHS